MPLTSRRPQLLAAWVSFASALGIVTALCGAHLHRSYERLDLEQRNRIQAQARVMSENVARQLAAVDHALEGIVTRLPSRPTPRTGHSLPLQILVSAMPGISAILLHDAAGTVILSDQAEQVGMRFGSQPYFETAKAASGSKRLLVSAPVPVSNGDLTLHLSKSITGEDGRFDGVITAKLDPAFFEAIARSVLYADDMTATIVHGSGRLFVDAQHSPAILGKDVSGPTTFFQRHMASGRDESLLKGFDVVRGRERMVALRTVTNASLQQDVPLVVSVGRDLRPIYQPWRDDVLLYVAGLSFVAAGASAALILFGRNRHAAQVAEQMRITQQAESARKMEFGLESARLGLWELDMASNVATLNARELQILGYQEGEFNVKPHNWRQLVPIADWGLIEVAMCSQLRNTDIAYVGEHRLRHREGRLIWVATHAIVTERDQVGKPVCVLGTHRDISDRKAAEIALTATAQRLQLAMEAGEMGSIDWHVPSGRVQVNTRGYDMLGLAPQAGEAGPQRWFRAAHVDDLENTQAYLEPLLNGTVSTVKREYRLRHADGRFVWIEMSAQVYERGADGEALRVMGAFRDINERVTFARELQEMNDKLACLTVTDGLTGVGNRRMFDHAFAQEWSRCARQSLPLSIVMMDIDEFKSFNDLHGHQGGDAALIEVGRILSQSVQRAGECVARYGGEEFVILLPGSDEAHGLAAAELCRRRLAEAKIDHGGSRVSPFLTVSIGIATAHPCHDLEPRVLLKAADNALYRAKDAGRDRIQVAEFAL